MSEAARLKEEINSTADEKQKAIKDQDRNRVTHLEEYMSELYDRLRRARAQEDHGPREEIQRQARVERELEKISSP